MPIDLNDVDGTEQDIAPPFEGRQAITLIEVTRKKLATGNKGSQFWLQWQGEGGRASTRFNWFTEPGDNKGLKQANNISWHQVIRPLAKAAGLSDGDMPKASEADIAKFLVAHEGELRVSATIAPDDRGYNEASKFQAA